MKIAIHFFMAYFLILALLPCADGELNFASAIITSTATESIEAADQDHHHHEGDCEDDFCTPLCVCSCCSISLDFPTETNIDFLSYPTKFNASTPWSIDSFQPTTYHNSIWHPPSSISAFFMG